MKSADYERPGRPFSTRAEGPSRRAAQQRKELSSPHSITSSGSEQCMPSPIAAKRKKEVSDPAAPQADDLDASFACPSAYESEMSARGPSRHFAALRNLAAIGAKRIWTKLDHSSSICEYAPSLRPISGYYPACSRPSASCV